MPRLRAPRSSLLLIIVALLGAVALGMNALYRQNLRGASPESATGVDSGRLINQPRPDFTLSDLEGLPYNIGEWDGKALMINFWATWCQPCRREIPMFVRLQEKFAGQGLQFIGVAIDDREAVKAFIHDLNITINYPVLIGGDKAISIANEYGDPFGILPYTVLIDRGGRIAFMQYGELSREQAIQLVQGVL